MSRQRFKLEVPSRSADTPRWRWVGGIAVAGFVVGIVLARVAGWQLVPRAPGGSGLDDQGDLEMAVSSASASSASPPPASASAQPTADRVQVGNLQVTSCRDAGKHRQKTCDRVALDEVLARTLPDLATCKGTEAAAGTLSLGLDVDFEAGKLLDVTSGRSTDLPKATTEALLECAKQALKHVDFSGIEHKYASYTVYAPVEIMPAQALDSAEPGADVVEASGSAVVTWQVAIVRQAPKTGDIVARLLSGTRVIVTGREGDWYRVKYDSKGTEGWVFKSAIGK